MSIPCQRCLQPAGWWRASAVCAGPCSSVLPGCGESLPASGSRPSGSEHPQWLEPVHHRRSGSPLPLYPSHSGPEHLKTHTSTQTCLKHLTQASPGNPAPQRINHFRHSHDSTTLRLDTDKYSTTSYRFWTRQHRRVGWMETKSLASPLTPHENQNKIIKASGGKPEPKSGGCASSRMSCSEPKYRNTPANSLHIYLTGLRTQS